MWYVEPDLYPIFIWYQPQHLSQFQPVHLYRFECRISAADDNALHQTTSYRGILCRFNILVIENLDLSCSIHWTYQYKFYDFVKVACMTSRKHFDAAVLKWGEYLPGSSCMGSTVLWTCDVLNVKTKLKPNRRPVHAQAESRSISTLIFELSSRQTKIVSIPRGLNEMRLSNL